MTENNIVEDFYNKNKLIIDYINNHIIKSYIEKAEISWKFAYEEYKVKGRGSIFIYLKDLEQGLTIIDIPSIYVTKAMVESMEYEAGKIIVDNYEYKEEFVVIICMDVTKDQALYRAHCIHKDLKFYKKDKTLECSISQDINSLGIMLLKETLENKGCRTCNKVSVKMYKCAKCGVAQYCSKECQREDWEIHKINCKLITLCHNK